jgi:hypothetical protein
MDIILSPSRLLDELAGLPKEQVEAIVEEAAHSRQRLSLSRHISEVRKDNFQKL